MVPQLGQLLSQVCGLGRTDGDSCEDHSPSYLWVLLGKVEIGDPGPRLNGDMVGEAVLRNVGGS
jgi:hypothetical protein